MFFFNKKKEFTIPAFSLGVFGKLPFYKDFLYSSFGSEFSELKMFFDTGINQLHKSGVRRPLVKPARNFYLFMENFQNDLVGCVWDSHDGLRAFPFIIAAPIPKKCRKESFTLFWNILNQFWGYLGEYYKELANQKSPSEFYQAVKGSKHQLNAIAIEEEDGSQSDLAIKAGMYLNDGLLARIPLSDMSDTDIVHFLNALHLRENPAMILWPREDWRSDDPVSGYMGTTGFDEFRISFFPPELAQESTPEESPEEEHEQEPEETKEAVPVSESREEPEEEVTEVMYVNDQLVNTENKEDPHNNREDAVGEN